MEAPEKIYLQDSMSTDTIGELWPEWFDAKVSDYSIEYTRTDAFFKKLEEWLNEYISDMVDVETRTLVGSFKNYMEGKLDYGR